MSSIYLGKVENNSHTATRSTDNTSLGVLRPIADVSPLGLLLIILVNLLVLGLFILA
jgi:hypothetical protein